MDNKQLTYAKGAIKVGFADQPVSEPYSLYGQHFADFDPKTPQEQVCTVNNIANNCRDWYSPVFSNESKSLPVDNCTPVEAAVVVVAAPATPAVQKTEEDDWFLTAVLFGAGAFVLYKIFS